MDLAEDIKRHLLDFLDLGEEAGGVYLMQPTGEVWDEDNTYIELEVGSKTFMAKPCMAFGSVNVPNKEWLQKYKDEISVYVSFENANPAHPVYLGCTPRDKAKMRTDFPNVNFWKSIEFDEEYNDKKKSYNFRKKDRNENFERGYTIDDKVIKFYDKDNNFWQINSQNGEIECKNKQGQGFKLNANTILGGGNGAQDAVLGNILKQLLQQALQTLASAQVIVNPATFIGVFDPAVITTLTTIIGQLDTMLSKKVKLD